MYWRREHCVFLRMHLVFDFETVLPYAGAHEQTGDSLAVSDLLYPPPKTQFSRDEFTS